MFTAIIVEDEYKIYQLISHLIDWDTCQVELIAYCPNGIVGLDTIKEKKPDIVITDMKMPGLTGVELISQAKESGSQAEFIVISGYKEFEFARGALVHGVTEYLLKPVNKKEINDALEKIVDKLKHRAQTADEIGSKAAKELLSQSFIQLVLSGGANTYDLDEINDRFDLNLEIGAYRMCNLTLFSLGQENYSGLPEYLKKNFGPVNALFKNILFFQNRDSNIFFLLNYDPDRITGKDIESAFSSVFKTISLPSPYVLGIGEEVLDVTSLNQSCDTAGMATYGRFQETSQHIFLYGSIPNDGKRYEEIASLQDLKRLEENAAMLEAENAAAIFDSIVGRITSFTNPSHIWKFFNHTIQTIYNVLCEKLDSKTAAQAKQDIMLRISGSRTLWQAALPLRNWIVSSITQCAENKQGSVYIRAAKSYIQEHYAEGLSLELLADHIDLNASYLSVLFKKELGLNFSEYLINVRIDAAKDLLSRTNDSVADICTKVGYTDSRHFSRLFTKKVGVKPSDYRRMIQ